MRITYIDVNNQEKDPAPKKVVYIAGPITGQEDGNILNFIVADDELSEAGWAVLNPRLALPDDMPSDRYMPICLAMLQQADAIYMLKGWELSKGAMIEHRLAKYQGKEVIYE